MKKVEITIRTVGVDDDAVKLVLDDKGIFDLGPAIARAKEEESFNDEQREKVIGLLSVLGGILNSGGDSIEMLLGAIRNTLMDSGFPKSALFLDDLIPSVATVINLERLSVQMDRNDGNPPSAAEVISGLQSILALVKMTGGTE
jgi:hypothetical protein